MKTILIALIASIALAQTRPSDEGIRRDQMVDLVAVSLTAAPENPVTGEQVRLSLTIVQPVRKQRHWCGRRVVSRQCARRRCDRRCGGTAKGRGAVDLDAAHCRRLGIDRPGGSGPEPGGGESRRQRGLARPGGGRRRAEECRLLGFGYRSGHRGRALLRSARECKTPGRPPPALRSCSASGTA